MPLESDIMKEKFLKTKILQNLKTQAPQVFMSDRMRAFKKVTDWKQRTEIIHERPDGFTKPNIANNTIWSNAKKSKANSNSYYSKMISPMLSSTTIIKKG
jgi:hypothetical protein